jgi:hypothetical protein
MQFLMEALRRDAKLPAAGEENSCTCGFCGDGGGAARLQQLCSSLKELAAGLLCEKVRIMEAHTAEGLCGATDEFMHYTPLCVKNACPHCSNAKKLPACKHLFEGDTPATWNVFETVTLPNGVKHDDQVVAKHGSVKQLSQAFVQYFHQVYTPHTAVARLQDHMHRVCLATFDTDTIVCECDFSEKFTHSSTVEVTCQTTPKSTLMIFIAHCNPRLDDQGRRVHDTSAYIVFSDDDKHDADFHRHAFRLIFNDIKRRNRDCTFNKVVVWSDGCGKQYKGRRNFKFVSRADQELGHEGLVLVHNFFATSHGKGEAYVL